MTETPQDPDNSQSAEKAKRNPMERLLVWGLILVGVVIACTEGVARFGYTMSLTALQDRVREDDAGEDSKPLMITDAENLMVGFPKKEEGNNQVTFRFKGLVKEFGAIHLKHDDDGLVLGLETDAPPEDEEPSVPEETTDDAEQNEDESGSSSDGNNDTPASNIPEPAEVEASESTEEVTEPAASANKTESTE